MKTCVFSSVDRKLNVQADAKHTISCKRPNEDVMISVCMGLCKIDSVQPNNKREITVSGSWHG